MIWVLVCNNKYRDHHNFGSFYRAQSNNLETVSIVSNWVSTGLIEYCLFLLKYNKENSTTHVSVQNVKIKCKEYFFFHIISHVGLSECSHATWCTSFMIAQSLNSLSRRENGHHFPDDIFKWILLNENVWILIGISLQFVPRCVINNIP